MAIKGKTVLFNNIRIDFKWFGTFKRSGAFIFILNIRQHISISFFLNVTMQQCKDKSITKI